MKRLAGMTILLLLWAGPRAGAAPRIVVDRPAYDFGSITNGSELRHDFVVRNAGDADLTIDRVVSSCTVCLQARIERTTIPAGGEVRLLARLDLRILEGPVSRGLLVYSNDPANSPLVLELTGTVIPLFQVTPASIDLDLTEGPRSASAEIVPLTGLRAPLSRIVSDNAEVTGELSPEGPGRFVVTVRPAPSFPRESEVAHLTLRSADAGDPPCRVTVVVRNPPDLELIPARLRFQPLADPQTRLLCLRQHGAAPLILLDVIPPSEKFRCEVQPEPDGSSYQIYVTALQQQSAGGWSGQIILKMQDQSHRERLVPIPISMDN